MKVHSYKRLLEARYGRVFRTVRICSSVPDAWLPTIRDMLSDAYRVTAPGIRHTVEFADIKEKRGHLSVSVHGGDQGTEAVVEENEDAI